MRCSSRQGNERMKRETPQIRSLAVEWGLLVLDQVLRGIQRVLDVIGLVWWVGFEDWINQAIHSIPIQSHWFIVSDNPHPTNQTNHSFYLFYLFNLFLFLNQTKPPQKPNRKTRDIDPSSQSLSQTLTNHSIMTNIKRERLIKIERDKQRGTEREFSRALSIKRCCRLQALLSHRNIESTHRDLVDEMHHTTLPSSTSMLAPSRVDLPRSEQCHHRHTRPFLSMEM